MLYLKNGEETLWSILCRLCTMPAVPNELAAQKQNKHSLKMLGAVNNSDSVKRNLDSQEDSR